MLAPAILTLNPCVDKNVYLSVPLTPGTIHRVENSVENIAGKGLNQAVVLANLGTRADYYSFGSAAGEDAMDAWIKTQHFVYHKTPTHSGIRQNLKVIDQNGVGTEINERGGPISADELDQILSSLDAFEGNLLSVCGSIPQGVEKSVYKLILSRAKARGMITVLDADGDALRLGMEACPDFIKPNRRELAGLCGVSEADFADEATVIAAARRIHEQYGTAVICTLDEQGSLYVGREGQWRVGVAKFPLRGFSGAGDTYLAAFLHARLAENQSVPEALAFAARASAAKISLPGSDLPTKDYINSVPDVEVKEL